jgi:hypothetical protein
MTHFRFPVARAALACLLGAGLAHAQNGPAADAPAENSATPWQLAQADLIQQVFTNPGAEPGLLAGGALAPERLIKGAPYCAEAVHENVQWLSDGSGGTPNRIVQQRSSLLCRDGEGRTRQEVDRGGRKVVYLRDPVAGESWVLDPERKTARRLVTSTMTASLATHDASAMRDFAERMREWARSMAESARTGLKPAMPTPPTPPSPPMPPVPPMPPTPAAPAAAPTAAGTPAPPAPVLITRIEDSHHQAAVRVMRLSNAADGAAGEWTLPPLPVQWRASHLAPRHGGTSSPLPARDIDGQRANGERTTWVIPAGKVGNEKPIEIVREVWTSPDLMLTLSSRDFDPRTGEVNYRLKAVKRGEPDAALMRVPADFSKPSRAAPRASGPTG